MGRNEHRAHVKEIAGNPKSTQLEVSMCRLDARFIGSVWRRPTFGLLSWWRSTGLLCHFLCLGIPRSYLDKVSGMESHCVTKVVPKMVGALDGTHGIPSFAFKGEDLRLWFISCCFCLKEQSIREPTLKSQSFHLLKNDVLVFPVGVIGNLSLFKGFPHETTGSATDVPGPA